MKTKDYMVAEMQLTYRNPQPPEKRIQIKNSRDSYNVLKEFYPDEMLECKEFVKVLLLNSQSEVLGCMQVAEGGLRGVYVDIRSIMQAALIANASEIILSHNHPSGNVAPSSEDRTLTWALDNACQVMNILLADHIILSPYQYYSFTDDEVLGNPSKKHRNLIVSEKKIFHI